MFLYFVLLSCDFLNPPTSVEPIVFENIEALTPYGAGELVVHSHYRLQYNEEAEQASWVAHVLEGKQLKAKKNKRSDSFRMDPLVSTKSAAKSDYKRSGYDRGHLAPAADFSFDKKAMKESFFMSNMSPQKPGFNRGVWKKLEEKTRKWALEHERLYVVSGPVLNPNSIVDQIGKSEVWVPEAYYKIIVDIQPPEYKSIAFLMKNEKSDRPLESFVVSIQTIEKETGIDFFPPLGSGHPLEIQSNPQSWFFE